MTHKDPNTPVGCMYEGPLDGSGVWTKVQPDDAAQCICHSNMGDIVVGNYLDGTGAYRAFLHDVKDQTYIDIEKEGASLITAYGVWHNGGDNYTFCGGYVEEEDESSVGNTAYLVDWDRRQKTFCNWRGYHYDNDARTAPVTHFDGITSDGSGGYYLVGDWIGSTETETESGSGSVKPMAFFSHVKRNTCGCFDVVADWSLVSYPGSQTTSGNTVYKNKAIGVYTTGKQDNTINGYVYRVSDF